MIHHTEQLAAALNPVGAALNKAARAADETAAKMRATGADWNSRNYSAAGQFTVTFAGESLVEAGYKPVWNISGNAKQRRKLIRHWKRQGCRVFQHMATGRYTSIVTDKER